MNKEMLSKLIRNDTSSGHINSDSNANGEVKSAPYEMATITSLMESD